ncbi:uncharacterized protein LOC110754599 [Prunus avium]|uniref:Uncharacterized protein LOC110754599 n=1 Tax=Prunus avium TaxID=42229 RepID=A0A6P5SC12_PRUAV|nr:uncharacterized protein LOC110754599 [Prunus avium]
MNNGGLKFLKQLKDLKFLLRNGLMSQIPNLKFRVKYARYFGLKFKNILSLKIIANSDTSHFLLKMTNLAKLEFVALDISGNNYLSWVLDANIHLCANSLGKTIVDGSDASPEKNANAMIFLRRHIHEVLKSEYVAVDDPLVMWKALCKRYNHQKMVILPRARYEWTHLRFQDFKSVSAYNSAMHRITSLMKLSGENISEEDMLEKTLSTFHASNVLLQQQYRHNSFTKYSELVSCLLLAEWELLLKNHQSRPTGSTPFHEGNAASQEVNATSSHGSIHICGRGGKRGCWQGNRKDRDTHSYGLGLRNNSSMSGKNASRNKGKAQTSHVPRNVEGACNRCGVKGHWAHTYLKPKHMVDLYQSSLKDKKVKTNYIDHVILYPPAINGPLEISHLLDMTHMDVSDFVIERVNEVNGSELD